MKVRLLGREWDVEFEPYYPRDRYEWRWWLRFNYSELRSDSFAKDHCYSKKAAREDLLTFLKKHGGEVLE